MADWRNIYSRELREMPPVDEWAAAYFGYKGPADTPGASDTDDDDDPGEWECPYPDETE